MLKEMIRVQWSRIRVFAVLVAMFCFSLPLVIIRVAPSETELVGSWLRNAEIVGGLIPITALIYAIVVAGAAWADDLKGNHVYALSLPISRERYVAYRFVSQVIALVLPPVALFAGCLVAAAAVHLPAGVHAYPVALASRFLLAIVICYAMFFAIATGIRRAAVVLLGVLVGLIALELLLSAVGVEQSLIGTVGELLTRWPGPFAILAGRWALFDV